MRVGRPVTNMNPIHNARKVKELDVLTEVPPFPTDPPLGHYGEKHWTDLCSSLIAAKVLASPFLPMIERTCRTFQRLTMEEKQMDQILRRDPNGNFIKTGTSIKPHPLGQSIQNLTKIHAQLLNYLGLSPAARRAANIPLQNDNGDHGLTVGARDMDGDSDDDLAA